MLDKIKLLKAVGATILLFGSIALYAWLVFNHFIIFISIFGLLLVIWTIYFFYEHTF